MIKVFIKRHLTLENKAVRNIKKNKEVVFKETETLIKNTENLVENLVEKLIENKTKNQTESYNIETEEVAEKTTKQKKNKTTQKATEFENEEINIIQNDFVADDKNNELLQ